MSGSGSTSNLGAAIVGLGEFGQRYATALAAVAGIDVVWGVDRSEANRDRAVAELGVPKVTEDLDVALADDAVDVVFVVTPESAHRAVAVPSLEAGKSVVVEKPLATDARDGAAMIAAAERSKGQLFPAFLLRFDYRYAQMKQRLDEIGSIHSAYAYRNFDRRLFELYSRTHSFIENAIHDIDLLIWMIGSEVVDAHGFTRNTLGLANPDVNWGVLEFGSGSVATLQTTWLYPPQAHRDLQWNAGLQLMGERGVLEVSNDASGFRANTEDAGILLLDQTGWSDIHGEPRGAFGAMLRHLVSVIGDGRVYRGTSPAEAMESMRVAHLLIESASTTAPPGRTSSPS